MLPQIIFTGKDSSLTLPIIKMNVIRYMLNEKQ